MNTTLTGPRSFKATIVPRCTTKSHGWDCACEQPATQTFDAANAWSKAEQRALFADYAQAAKDAVGTPRRDPRPWGDIPQFTEPAHTAQERELLGREVGFKNWSTFTPLGDGTSVSSNAIRGTVWSLSPSPKCFWVYVEGQGFYAVREDHLLTGVNA